MIVHPSVLKEIKEQAFAFAHVRWKNSRPLHQERLSSYNQNLDRLAKERGFRSWHDLNQQSKSLESNMFKDLVDGYVGAIIDEFVVNNRLFTNTKKLEVPLDTLKKIEAQVADKQAASDNNYSLSDFGLTEILVMGGSLCPSFKFITDKKLCDRLDILTSAIDEFQILTFEPMVDFAIKNVEISQGKEVWNLTSEGTVFGLNTEEASRINARLIKTIKGDGWECSLHEFISSNDGMTEKEIASLDNLEVGESLSIGVHAGKEVLKRN